MKNKFIKDPNSLTKFGYNIYSQRGDDGIIEEIFKRLNIINGTFVEFGAHNGILFSNTKNLTLKSWKGVMIESDEELFLQLSKNYENNKLVNTIHAKVIEDNVTPKEGEINLKQIQSKYFNNEQIDFISIDIDFNDIELFEKLELNPMPKVIAIETGLYWHPKFNKRIPFSEDIRNLQQPLDVSIGIAIAKGYIPVCFNQNLYIILKEYFNLFSNIENNTESLWYNAYYSDNVFTDEERQYILTVRQENETIKKFEGNSMQLFF